MAPTTASPNGQWGGHHLAEAVDVLHAPRDPLGDLCRPPPPATDLVVEVAER
jgi:hypothetical protein